MPRFKMVNGERIQLTAAEEIYLDPTEKVVRRNQRTK